MLFSLMRAFVRCVGFSVGHLVVVQLTALCLKKKIFLILRRNACMD